MSQTSLLYSRKREGRLTLRREEKGGIALSLALPRMRDPKGAKKSKEKVSIEERNAIGIRILVGFVYSEVALF